VLQTMSGQNFRLDENVNNNGISQWNRKRRLKNGKEAKTDKLSRMKEARAATSNENGKKWE